MPPLAVVKPKRLRTFLAASKILPFERILVVHEGTSSALLE
jgi:hypothetical protein